MLKCKNCTRVFPDVEDLFHFRTHNCEIQESTNAENEAFYPQPYKLPLLLQEDGEKAYSSYQDPNLFKINASHKTLELKENFGHHAIAINTENLFHSLPDERRFPKAKVPQDNIQTQRAEKPIQQLQGTLCKEEFYNEPNIQLHERHYSEEKTFKCPICERKFTHNSYLKSHMQCHTTEKLFKCNICGKKVKRKFCLKRHMRIHAAEKPLKCEICEKQYKRQDKLKEHMWTHSVEKPIKCNLCKKQFIWQSQLKKHMLTHTG